MENVLELYAGDPANDTARVGFDERPCQLLEDILAPLPMKEGKVEKQDYEYKRGGTAVIMLAYDFDTGQRYTQVREQRTKKDYAEFMEWLVKEHYGHVAKVELVQDNLNTHCYGSFYDHLPAQEARLLCQKLNFHFTPKHGSWLNVAEIEFSALARQCLNRRIESIEKLRHEVDAWSKDRNKEAVKVHWSFTVDVARQKLARQYHKVNQNNNISIN
jgi:hypothetical protein